MDAFIHLIETGGVQSPPFYQTVVSLMMDVQQLSCQRRNPRHSVDLLVF